MPSWVRWTHLVNFFLHLFSFKSWTFAKSFHSSYRHEEGTYRQVSRGRCRQEEEGPTWWPPKKGHCQMAMPRHQSGPPLPLPKSNFLDQQTWQETAPKTTMWRLSQLQFLLRQLLWALDFFLGDILWVSNFKFTCSSGHSNEGSDHSDSFGSGSVWTIPKGLKIKDVSHSCQWGWWVHPLSTS